MAELLLDLLAAQPSQPIQAFDLVLGVKLVVPLIP